VEYAITSTIRGRLSVIVMGARLRMRSGCFGGRGIFGGVGGMGGFEGLGRKGRDSEEDENGANVRFGKRGRFMKNEIDSLKGRTEPE
jgi:hypothetical protein